MTALPAPAAFEAPAESVLSRAQDSALERVLRSVRLRALRRAIWLRKLWSEEGEPGGSLAVTHAEVDTILLDHDAPEAEAAWIATEPLIAETNRELEELEAEIAADSKSRLALLCRTFTLEDDEKDLFHLVLAVALEPALARVCAYLHDQAARPYVTDGLATRLYGRGRTGLWRTGSNLAVWELVSEREVEPAQPPALTIDPFIRDWLLGNATVDSILSEAIMPCSAKPPLNGWPDKKTATLIRAATRQEARFPVRVQVVGPCGSGRRTFAACVTAKLGLDLVAIDLDGIEDEAWPRAFVRAQRAARLNGQALAWTGERAHCSPWPRQVPQCPVQFLISEPHQEPREFDGIVEYRVGLPATGVDERRELWQRFVPEYRTWKKDAFEDLVAQHRTTVCRIAALARKQIEEPEHAASLIREMDRHRLGRLATPIECPFDWQDLVAPERVEQSLRDFEFEARKRAAFWERDEAMRLFPQGRGLIALFSGPPGTGKTMAAQVIAADLGLGLYRIDLSAVVSKYVGETSQNLEKILSRAAHMDVVLLFDEADALFGKRTDIRDAHDRFANTDTGYLLQAIENYEGIAILSTNKKSNIDTAFIRRIRYVVDLPKPDPSLRLQIWVRILGELAGQQAVKRVAAGLQRLANLVETTGAQIKFAILAALYSAQREGSPLGVRHLLRGVEQELIKDGRALTDQERESLQSDGP